MPNWQDRIEHLNECEREASRQMRAIKAGRAADAAAGAAEQSRVNIDGWKKLIRAYQRSPVREAILSSFSGNWFKWWALATAVRLICVYPYLAAGNWEVDFIQNERLALAFLALHLYFESSGCRFDVIARM